MTRPLGQQIEKTCPMCGAVRSLSPSVAARFHWCNASCRWQYGDAVRLWDGLIWRLTEERQRHGAWGMIGRDVAWSAGDPKDRARLAIVDGEETLFVRDGEGWLVFHIGHSFHGDKCFVGPPSRTDVAPECEARQTHMEDLRASYAT